MISSVLISVAATPVSSIISSNTDSTPQIDAGNLLYKDDDGLVNALYKDDDGIGTALYAEVI